MGRGKGFGGKLFTPRQTNVLNKRWQDLPFRQAVVYVRERGYETEVSLEQEAIEKNFKTVYDLREVRPGDLVISRFSQRPFAQLLFNEFDIKGARSFNTIDQVDYIEDARRWYADLKDLTPKSWFSETDAEGGGPFFVKGITNSVKENWEKFSYAEDKKDLSRVIRNLRSDPLLSEQDLFIREYVELNYDHRHPETGSPLAEEYRVFVCDNKVLSRGVYINDPLTRDLLPPTDTKYIPNDFLQTTIERIGDQANYYALDVARTRKDDWIVIELNDASQTGLAGNDPNVLYRELAKTIKNYGGLFSG